MQADFEQLNFPTTLGATKDGKTLAFAPQAVIAWSNVRNETVDTVNNIDSRRTIGVAVSDASRRGIAQQSDHAAATSATDKDDHDDSILSYIATNGTVAGLIDINTFGATNVQYIVDQATGRAYRANMLYLGGLTGAEIVSFVQPTAGGAQDQDVSISIGGATLILIFSAMVTTDPQSLTTGGATMVGMVGVGGTGTITQGVFATRSLDAQVTASVCYSLCRSGEAISIPHATAAGTCVARATVSSVGSSSFRVAWSEIDANARRFFALVVRGGSWAVVGLQTQTDTSTLINTGSLGFTPNCGLVISAMATETAADSTQADDAWTMGGFTSASNRGCLADQDLDNQGTQVCTSAVRTAAVAALLSNNAVDAVVDVSAVNSDNVDFIMDDADASGRFFLALIGGTPDPVIASDSGSLDTNTQFPPLWRWRN